MRISYKYTKFQNSPRATEFSHDAESTAAIFSPLVSIGTLGSAIALLVCTFSFWGNYDNTVEFIASICFAIVMARIDFYYFVSRPNDNASEINLILFEDTHSELSTEEKLNIRIAAKKKVEAENKSDLLEFFPIFFSILFDAIAVIAVIKSIYLLVNEKKALVLLACAIVASALFTYLAWRFINYPFNIKSFKKAPVSRKNIHSAPRSANTVEDPCTEISFCRKCGAKVLSVSVFCTKCGAKIR